MIESLKIATGLGSYYLLYYTLVFVGLLFALMPIYLLRKQLPPISKKIIAAVIIIIIFRFILLDNPVAWKFYHNSLSEYRFGHNLISIITNTKRKYKRELNPKKIDILAVGSSQVGHLFRGFRRSEIKESVAYYSSGGLGPLDYMLYRKHFFMKYHPDTIMLYVSEFDLGKLLWERYQRAPSQGSYLIELSRELKKYGYQTESRDMFRNLLIGEFFPEYKYSFVFKALLNKALSKNENKREYRSANREFVKIGQASRIKTISGTPFEFNLAFLENFIIYCEKRGTKVLILEGQRNPESYNKDSHDLIVNVRNRLSGLAVKYSHVSFLPLTELYPLKAGDFKDLIHVTPDAAARFRKHLFEKLTE